MLIQKERLIKKPSKVRAVILTANRFEDMELFYPYFRLLELGIEVDVAAPRIQKLTGKNGYVFENVDLPFARVNPDHYDLLLLPGGVADGAPTAIRKSKNAQYIVKSFFVQNKPVAAICHGPCALISAGVLKGRRLTGYLGDGVPEEIKAAGGHYEDKDVIVDGNLVTSRSPADLPLFMRETMKMIRQYSKNKVKSAVPTGTKAKLLKSKRKTRIDKGRRFLDDAYYLSFKQ
jgi:protease I